MEGQACPHTSQGPSLESRGLLIYSFPTGEGPGRGGGTYCCHPGQELVGLGRQQWSACSCLQSTSETMKQPRVQCLGCVKPQRPAISISAAVGTALLSRHFAFLFLCILGSAKEETHCSLHFLMQSLLISNLLPKITFKFYVF